MDAIMDTMMEIPPFAEDWMPQETKPAKVTKMSKKKAKELAILDLVEYIVSATQGSGMKQETLKKAENALCELGKRYGLTANGALFLAALMDMDGCRVVDVGELANFFGVKRIHVQKYWGALLNLADMRYLENCSIHRKDHFSLQRDVVRKARMNEVYTPPCYENISSQDFFKRVHELYGMLDDDLTTDEFLKETNELMRINPQLPFVQGLQSIGPLDRISQGILLITAMKQGLFGSERVTVYEVDDLIEDIIERMTLIDEISDGTHELMRKKLIENYCDEGMACQDEWCLTEKARAKLIGDIARKKRNISAPTDLLLPEKITPKTLYFCPEMQQEVDKLRKILQPEQFRKVQERLAENGMRKGIACIFYGAPGTGKTELLLQLARESGRAVMLVDISEMRDKYVGETEKRIKGVFDRYRSAVKTMELAPILVFNEADAILCKRNQNALLGVDKMENAMQNIILQEMETFEGMMVATTNMVGNMDAAFERRFLYKLEFQVPRPEEAQHIWRAILPDLQEHEALQLAEQYAFSGGQIENIARKLLISSIMEGEQTTLQQVWDACRQETFHRPSGKQIGFAS